MLQKLCDFELISQIFGGSSLAATTSTTSVETEKISDSVNHPSCSFYVVHLIFNLFFIYISLLILIYHKCWQTRKCSKSRSSTGLSSSSSPRRIPSKRGSNNGVTHTNGKRYSRADSGGHNDSKRVAKLFQQRTVFSHHISIWSLTLVILVAVGAELSENVILHLNKHSSGNSTRIINPNEQFSNSIGCSNDSVTGGERSNRVNRFISSTSSNLYENNDSNSAQIDLTASSSDNYDDSYPLHSSRSVLSLVNAERGRSGRNSSEFVIGPGDHYNSNLRRSARSSSGGDRVDVDDHHNHQIIYEYLKIIGPLVSLTAASVLLVFYHQFERIGESKYLLINVLFYTVTTILFLTNVYLHLAYHALTLLHVKVAANAVLAFVSVILTALLTHTVIHEVNYLVYTRASLYTLIPHDYKMKPP